MKLYEISAEYQKVLDLIEECGEITPDLMERLDNLNMSGEQKILNTAARIKNLESDLESMDKYIKDMEKRKQRVVKEIAWCESYLETHMPIMGFKVVESPEFNVRLRTNQYKLDLFDEAIIPKEYIKTKVTSSISRQDISKDLKLGCEIPGARFVTSQSVQIK